ncbi:MAG: protein kinase [Chloroflexota bacterium]
MDPLEGRTLGSYLLEKRMGGGGMGSVYRARHVRLEQVRAVKVMSLQFVNDDSFVRLFYREARLAAGLHHPNIVQIHDVADHDGQPYIVMELLEGRSLRDVIYHEQPVSLDRVVHLVRQLASALDHAHENGIAHRDIKPANVFVSPNDVVTLVDFGIARAADATRMTVTYSIGTPEYMAPERFDERLARPGATDHELGMDADLYALGVVAYELIAGRPPFRGRTREAIIFERVQHDPEPLRPSRPEVTDDIESVVLRQLSKLPTSRFSTSSAFATALADAVRIDSLLAEAREAITSDRLDDAERLQSDVVTTGLRPRVADALHHAITARRAVQERRTHVVGLLDRGDWRAAREALRSLEQAGLSDFAALIERADALRTAEAFRVEAERQVFAEAIAAQQRQDDAWRPPGDERQAESKTSAVKQSEAQADPSRSQGLMAVERMLAKGSWRSAEITLQRMAERGEAGLDDLVRQVDAQRRVELEARAHQADQIDNQPGGSYSSSYGAEPRVSSSFQVSTVASSRQPHETAQSDVRIRRVPPDPGDANASSRIQRQFRPTSELVQEASRASGSRWFWPILICLVVVVNVWFIAIAVSQVMHQR